MGGCYTKSRPEKRAPPAQVIAMEVVRVRFWTTAEGRAGGICAGSDVGVREESRMTQAVA